MINSVEIVFSSFDLIYNIFEFVEWKLLFRLISKTCYLSTMNDKTPEKINKYLFEFDKASLLSNNIKVKNDIYIENAIIKGDLQLVILLFNLNCPRNNDNIWKLAAVNNHLHILKWSYDFGFCLGQNIFVYAVKSRNIDMLKWLYSETEYYWNNNIALEAIKINNMEIINWLYNSGCPFDKRTSLLAIKLNNLEIIKWLHNNRISFHKKVTSIASKTGNLKIFTWLIENNYKISSDTILQAVLYEKLLIINWLFYNTELDIQLVCYEASFHGKIEILKYLHNKTSILHINTIPYVSTIKGHLNILEWYYRIGGIINNNIYLCALHNRQDHILEWLGTNQ